MTRWPPEVLPSLRLFAAASLTLSCLACAQAQTAVGRPPLNGDVGVGPVVLAQTSDPKPADTKPVDTKSAETKPVETKPAGAKPVETPAKKPEASPGGTAAVVLDFNAVESVIGMSVKSFESEDMGHIVDILVTAHGEVRAAVIDFGGVLGVGSRKVAVDWRTLKFSGDGRGGPAILALSRNQVRVAPEYKSGDPVVVLMPPKGDDAKAPKAEPKGVAAPAPAPTGDIKQ